jgi:hypothetical protein
VTEERRGPAREQGAPAPSRPPLPRQLTLPSGRRVKLSERAITDAAARSSRLVESALSAAWSALAAPAALVDDTGPVTVGDLPLSDAHVLAALVFRAGLVEEPRVDVRCDNCDRAFSVQPSSAVEPGPFVDDELSDPELDAPFDFDRNLDVPPIFTPSGRARWIRLAPRTVEQASALFHAGGRLLPLSRGTVMALGIVAIGRERRAVAIARALERASDEAWTAIGQHWEEAHLPARLVADVFCECGARCPVFAPGQRAFDAVAGPSTAAPEARSGEGFPTIEQFEEQVERARRIVYAARGVRNVPLIVDDGVPACDDGGEPLLGSYLPATSLADGLGEGLPEIRLYYRTFQSQFRADETFDVAAEIRETIDHEVEHHLFNLSGHDPMDADERAVIARERARVVGRSELVRRELKGVATAVRALLPLLVLLGVLTVIQFCRG